jgi:hypothetical protein
MPTANSGIALGSGIETGPQPAAHAGTPAVALTPRTNSKIREALNMRAIVPEEKLSPQEPTQCKSTVTA